MFFCVAPIITFCSLTARCLQPKRSALAGGCRCARRSWRHRSQPHSSRAARWLAGKRRQPHAHAASLRRQLSRLCTYRLACYAAFGTLSGKHRHRLVRLRFEQPGAATVFVRQSHYNTELHNPLWSRITRSALTAQNCRECCFLCFETWHVKI